MNLLNLKSVIFFGVVTLSCTNALGSEGDVDYRHSAMKAIGGHMQAIAKIVRREVSHSEHLVLHANAMADMASITPDLFPEGSHGSETLPAIWEQPEDFAERLDAFRSAAETFKQAAASGNSASIGSAIRGLGQSCKGCHDNYREE